MPSVRIVFVVPIALTVALTLGACGKDEAPKPAAKPATPAPSAAPAPAPQPSIPITTAPAAPPASAAPGAPDPDKELAKKVKSVLDATQGVTGQQIDVTAKGGAITLWGTVADPAEQAKAVEAAKAVPGVKAVENKLAIVKGS